jgi:hypothetical protein
MADIQRYLNLITSEHQNKPKFTAWLTAALSKIDDGAILANELNTHFDIDDAIGNQLDILGDIVGVKRTLSFQPTDGTSPILDDDTYRLVIQAKILRNRWDGTIPQMYELWNSIFPGTRLGIQDNQDMSADITISLFSRLQKDLTTNGYIIPKPQAVKLNVILLVGLSSNDIVRVSETISWQLRPKTWAWGNFIWGQINW